MRGEHPVGVITTEVAGQRARVVMVGDKLLAKHLEGAGWLDCSKGAQMIWVHPDLRNPADGDQVFVQFDDAVEIQSRWELGWPNVRVKDASTKYQADAPEASA